MLAEKKEALYTELDKTKVVLDEAKKRLAIYEQEINAREILANSGSAAKKIKSGDFTGLFDLAQANEAAMRYSIAKRILVIFRPHITRLNYKYRNLVLSLMISMIQPLKLKPMLLILNRN